MTQNWDEPPNLTNALNPYLEDDYEAERLEEMNSERRLEDYLHEKAMEEFERIFPIINDEEN